MSHGQPIQIRGATWTFWSKTNPIAPSLFSEDVFQFPIPVTIVSIRHLVRSATGLATLDFTLRHALTPTFGVSPEIIVGGMTSDNTQTLETVFSDANIAADEYVVIENTALTNGPAQTHVIQVVLA